MFCCVLPSATMWAGGGRYQANESLVNLFNLCWWIAICAWHGIYEGNLVLDWVWQHFWCHFALPSGLHCFISLKCLFHDCIVNIVVVSLLTSYQCLPLTDFVYSCLWPLCQPSIHSCPHWQAVGPVVLHARIHLRHSATLGLTQFEMQCSVFQK